MLLYQFDAQDAVTIALFIVIAFIAGWKCCKHWHSLKRPVQFSAEYRDVCAAIMRERRVRASAFYFDVFNAGMLVERSRNSTN